MNMIAKLNLFMKIIKTMIRFNLTWRKILLMNIDAALIAILLKFKTRFKKNNQNSDLHPKIQKRILYPWTVRVPAVTPNILKTIKKIKSLNNLKINTFSKNKIKLYKAVMKAVLLKNYQNHNPILLIIQDWSKSIQMNV